MYKDEYTANGTSRIFGGGGGGRTCVRFIPHVKRAVRVRNHVWVYNARRTRPPGGATQERYNEPTDSSLEFNWLVFLDAADVSDLRDSFNSTTI